jgi:hypothetical protein
MTKIIPIKSDYVTDGQLSAMRQAIGRTGCEPWIGEMGAALECCDRGWLSVAHLSQAELSERDSVYYLITVSGAAVARRERGREVPL